jgi:uncharacterized iron-regulated membrane protein
MSYTFTSTPTTDIYRVTYKSQGGRIMEEIVKIPTGSGAMLRDMTESKYGSGSFLGASPIGSE